MVEKTPLVLDSVRRLVRLNVSEKEIITYLLDVGFTEQQAVELLAEAKIKEGVKPEKPVPSRPALKIERQPFKKPVSRPSRDLTRLWEKGIIVTVNGKLDEMKKIRKGLDTVLNKKISKAMEKEHKKMEVLFESRKALMVNKINKSLDDKVEEVQSSISTQLKEISELNLAAKSDLDRLEARRVLIKDLYTRANQALLEMKETKVRLQKEVAVSLEESKEKTAQLDERVSRTLELESKITEGLVADAKDRVEEEIEGKMADLEDIFKRKLTALKAQPPPAVNPEDIRKEVLAELKPLEEKIDAQLRLMQQAGKENDRKIKELEGFKKTISSEINSLLSLIEKRMLK